MGEMSDLDAKGNVLFLKDGSRIDYDYLIVATGSSHSYFGNDQWAANAPGLKTLEDALEIRRRVLLAYEQAERTEDLAEREAFLTFVVVGGGPTGLELAGALGEMAHLTLRDNFRSIDPGAAKIILVEAAERLLPPYPPDLSSKAAASLARLGVTVMMQAMVTGVTDRQVTVRKGESTTTIPTRTVLWAAGVQASPLGKVVQSQTGVALDRVGRVMVEPDLSVPGFPNLFVVGDLAHFAHGVERPLPGVAPVAMQQGRYVAEVIRHRLAGTSPQMFRYFDKGSMATIGRAAAVAQIGRLKLSGYPAWLSWLFIHLLYLAGFDNRVLVFLQWVWNYFTYRRGVRLIVNESSQTPSEA
jgi:NADH dehydrogenase